MAKEDEQNSSGGAPENKDPSDNGSEQAKETESNRKSTANTIFKAAGFEIEADGNFLAANPIELLEKLYLIKHDESLTDGEKRKKVQEIIRDYMG